jgi:hypothetical protein
MAKIEQLHVVKRKPLPPEQMLRIVVPDLAEAERVARRLREVVREQGRLLAKERGCAFIREERLIQEFSE